MDDKQLIPPIPKSIQPAPPADGFAPIVLRVIETVVPRTPEMMLSMFLAGHPAYRTFSVVLSKPCGDLAIVAAAKDPKSGVVIPAPDSPHPACDKFIARPPMIYPVGLRLKGGAMLATRSNFYNVRVPYVEVSKREGA